MMNPLPFTACRFRLVWPSQAPARLLPLAMGLLGCFAMASQALAEVNSRSSFPGRRVGGGTRGECTARLVANLVPKSHVYAPGASGLIGILQGPSANLHPLILTFKPATAAGVVEPGTSLLASREIAAAPVGLVLVKAPSLRGATQWETSYRCEGGRADPDPLSFVSAGAPPAVSLLVLSAEPVDRLFQAELAQLKAHCGGTIAREQIAKAFALEEVLGQDWPAQLPVRCL